VYHSTKPCIDHPYLGRVKIKYKYKKKGVLDRANAQKAHLFKPNIK